MPGIYNIKHYVIMLIFELLAGVIYLSFLNRHCSKINLLKEKQGGLIPTGLKGRSFKLIKHFADTTRVLPSPAGRCPLNFLNLINLKFRVKAPNRSCILLFRSNQSFVCNFLSTPKSQVPAKETKCLSC